MDRPADHLPVAAEKVGVLLVNLGTPDAPTTEAVKRYLKQFLSDRRVVEIPPAKVGRKLCQGVDGQWLAARCLYQGTS
jgi:hypothetical protein